MNNYLITVFGASGGVGESLCKRLSRSFRVVGISRSAESALRLQQSVGCEIEILSDTSFEAYSQVLNTIREKYGPLHGIANCIGSLLLKPAHLTSELDWDQTLETNLKSCFAILKFGIPHLLESKGAAVFVSSAAAKIGLANHEAIAAAKAGIEGLVRAAAASYASKGVRINAVAPGLTETPLTQKITSNPTSREYSQRLHPIGRLGRPEDISSAIAWLLDPEQSWISGQVISVDGGLAGLKS